MKKNEYEAVEPFKFNGVRYAPGDLLDDVEGKQLKALEAAGLIRLNQASPDDQPASGG